MTLDEIRELIQLLTASGIAELEVQRGEDRVRIRRGFSRVAREVVAPDAPAAAAAAAGPSAVRSSGVSQAARPAAPVVEEPAEDASLHVVKSPIVGTFYEAASPDAPPFVRIGDAVQPGQVLCIIESMKLMNEIESETAGVIVSKLIANAQPVEYGEALFTIRPL